MTRQREDCLALCQSKGWKPIEPHYLDNDTSATSGERRPAYERMLADVRDGRVGAVVVWDLDRLHRRPIELESFMALADEKHLALATVSGDVDLSTAQGRLVARLKGSVAAHEGEHRKARQLRATRQLAERGVPNWSQAFGYDDTRQPDPVTAPLVKQAYAAVLAGASLGDVCRLFNEAGALTVNGKPWTPTVVSKFLRKPRNAGLRTYGVRYGAVTRNDIVGKGNWPPLVDEQTFWAAQAVLDAPGRAPGRKSVRKHLLTGVLGCGKCGGYLSGAYVGKTAKHLTYICKGCHGINVRAEYVEPLLYDIVGGRLAMDDAVDLLKAEIQDQEQAEAIRAEINALYGELDALAVERAEGLMTARQVKISSDIITEKIAKLERRQQDQERVRVFRDLPLGTPEVVDAVRALSPDRFRAVVDVLMTVTVAPVGKSGRVFNPDRVQVNWR
ncbi:MAG TPA: recombinase family protein [Mycobacterium sp.]|nr:recombinase family protein [Mycobacterium sp.]